MPDEIKPDPIPDPKPVQRPSLLESNDPVLIVLGLAAIGGVIFAVSITPTRTMGATRSARIKWQHGQPEVQKSDVSAPAVNPEATPPKADADPTAPGGQ